MTNWAEKVETDGTEKHDNQINKLIDEFNYYTNLGDFSYQNAVDTVFGELAEAADKLERLAIAEDVMQITANAAVMGAYFSFGMSMAAFITAEVEAAILQAEISSKIDELTDKMKNADTEIANLIGSNVPQYVNIYKENNAYVSEQAPDGFGLELCRYVLMQLFAVVYKIYKEKDESLESKHVYEVLSTIKTTSALPEMEEIYNALDTINLYGSSEARVESLLKSLSDLNKKVTDSNASAMVTFIVFNKLDIDQDQIAASAKKLDIDWENQYAGHVKKGVSESCTKFQLALGAILNVVGVVIECFQIADVVEKTEALIKSLKNDIKPNYESFFADLKTSSMQYVEMLNQWF